MTPGASADLRRGNADPDRVDPPSRLVLWIVGAWLVALVCTGIVCLAALPWIMAALRR